MAWLEALSDPRAAPVYSRLGRVVDSSGHLAGLRSAADGCRPPSDGRRGFGLYLASRPVWEGPDRSISRGDARSRQSSETIQAALRVEFSARTGLAAIKFRHFASGAPIPFLVDYFRIDDQRTGRPMNIATVSCDLTAQRSEVQLLKLPEIFGAKGHLFFTLEALSAVGEARDR
jgi:hypothetical protein